MGVGEGGGGGIQLGEKGLTIKTETEQRLHVYFTEYIQRYTPALRVKWSSYGKREMQSVKI